VPAKEREEIMNNKIQSILKDQRGAGFTEYLILVGLIAIVCIVAFTSFGEAIGSKADEFTGEIGGL
jgi:Flp pilus assembly pilin Flp